MRQKDSEWPKFWNLGYFWSCPKNFEIAQKINSVPLGPVTEPKGFKLDMHGPEGSTCPKGGSEAKEHEIDQKVNGIDKLVNGIDQIVSDHFLD